MTEQVTDIEKVEGDQTKTGGDGGSAGKQAEGTKTTEDLSGTVLDDGGQKKAEAAPATAWPEDWQARLAGKDEKLLARLQRMRDPGDVLKSWLNAEKKISQKTPSLLKPAEGASEEEIKAWREATGVPETPDKYELKLSNGREIGEEDKPIADEMLKTAHKLGMNTEQASGVIDWYYDVIEAETQELNIADEEYRDQTVQSLREEWGPADYKRNIGAAMQIFEGADEKIVIDAGSGATMDMKTAILGARMPNGHKIGGDATALRFLTRIGLDLMPLDKEIPAGETNGSVENRLEEIRRIRRMEPDKYEANAKKYEEEETRLLEAQMKRQGRSDRAA